MCSAERVHGSRRAYHLAGVNSVLAVARERKDVCSAEREAIFQQKNVKSKGPKKQVSEKSS